MYECRVALVLLVVPIALSASLLVAAVVVQIRANPGVRVPWAKPSNPLHDPAAARLLRGLGVGLTLLVAISHGDQLAWWGGALIVGAFLPSGLLILLHNRRMTAQPAP